MRKKVNQSMAEARMVKRYHRLHTPLIELIQSLEDLTPDGLRLGDKVELTQTEGHINVVYIAKPVEIVINDGVRRFTLKIEESPKKR
jgi:hypothetical protein